VNLTFVLSLIQERSYVIMLGKWWQVLLVLIAFIVVAVWLIIKASRQKQP
jgi:hypothetical protein